jgi:hypothetical protein
MTAHFTRKILAAALIASAGVVGSAGVAQAKPVKQLDAYNACYAQLKPKEGSTAASFDCCVVAGGAWKGGTYPEGYCELKNAPVPASGSQPGRVPARMPDQTELNVA